MLTYRIEKQHLQSRCTSAQHELSFRDLLTRSLVLKQPLSEVVRAGQPMGLPIHRYTHGGISGMAVLPSSNIQSRLTIKTATQQLAYTRTRTK